MTNRDRELFLPVQTPAQQRLVRLGKKMQRQSEEQRFDPEQPTLPQRFGQAFQTASRLPTLPGGASLEQVGEGLGTIGRGIGAVDRFFDENIDAPVTGAFGVTEPRTVPGQTDLPPELEAEARARGVLPSAPGTVFEQERFPRSFREAQEIGMRQPESRRALTGALLTAPIPGLGVTNVPSGVTRAAGRTAGVAARGTGRAVEALDSAALRQLERVSPARPAQAMALKPTSEALRDMDKQIASVQRAIKTAQEVGADTASLDDTLTAMRITRRNILENELGPERFARLQEVEGELSEVIFQRDAIRDGRITGQAPQFGTPEREAYTRTIARQRELLRNANIEVERLQNEYDRLVAGLPEEVAQALEPVAAPRPPEPTIQTGAVQTRLIGEGAGGGQMQMLPEFRGSGETPRQRIQAEAAERAAREAEAARTAPLEGQQGLPEQPPVSPVRPAAATTAPDVPPSPPPPAEAAGARPVDNAPQAAEAPPPPAPPREPPAPPTGGPPTGPVDPDDVVKRFVRVIREAKPARAVTEAEVTAELGKRAARAKAALARGDRVGAFAAFKGELPKTADIEALAKAFTAEEGEALRAMIDRKFVDSPFKFLQAQTAFTELFDNGKIPVRSQLVVLEEVFGKEFVDSILSLRGLGERAWEVFREIWNVPKALLATGDMSATLRQAAPLMFEDGGKAYRGAFKAQLKAFAREENAKAVSDAIAAHPMYETSQRAGLDLTLPSTVRASDLAKREEPFIGARILQQPVRVPVGGGRTVNVNLLGEVVKASERAYVTMLNKARFDTFVKEAEKLGSAATTDDLKAIANTINILTGRSSLGAFTEASQILNGVFFAPRFAVSRFQTPFTVAFNRAPARKLAARALVSYATTVTTMLALADLSGVATVDWNPVSSDFGKFRVGNTRIDPWAGLQQPVVLVARLASGKTRPTGQRKLQDIDPGVAIQRFFESKLAPSTRLLFDARRGEGFGGEGLLEESPIPNVPNILFNQFVFLFMQDALEAVEEHGAAGAAVGPITFFGLGATTFEDSGGSSSAPSTNRLRRLVTPGGAPSRAAPAPSQRLIRQRQTVGTR